MMEPALGASYRFCASVARREAKNFYYSFLLLPPRRKRAMCVLYAFLRRTDDLADGPGSAAEKRTAIGAWRAELDRVLGGDAGRWPGFAALADTVRRHGLPRRYIEAVIDGVEMDIEPRPFLTFDELYRYCYRVASAVGLSCLHIWGYRSSAGRAEALAEACGVALQLTNIVRDVKQDALDGRVYLPQEDLDRFGIVRKDLMADRPDAPTRRLLAFEAQRAYAYYDQSAPLVDLVAPVGRPGLRAIVGIYRALLNEVVRRDYDVFSARVAISPWRKSAIAISALAGWPGASAGRRNLAVVPDAQPVTAEPGR
jgi:phytoene synthase